MKSLAGMNLKEIESVVLSLGEKAYRAKQILEAVNNGVDSIDRIHTISKDFRAKLSNKYTISSITVEKKLVSKRDGSIKYLLKTSDGKFIEAMSMVYKHGVSLCISSQAGCRMGCTFCSSGKEGLERNLSAFEMIEQVLILKRGFDKISGIVVMGTGEPFDNYDELKKFLKRITNEEFLGIGKRHITVSTCGIEEGIKKFSKDFRSINLAFSLHAASNDIRKKIMPGNKLSVDDIIGLASEHAKITRRRVTFEYILIKGVNDSMAECELLCRKLKGINCLVNLIRLNGSSYEGDNRFSLPDMKTVKQWQNELEKRHIQVTIRRTIGEDIQGACGQLRLRKDIA